MIYVYIHCLDHSFYTLLAAGYSCFSFVSCFLVAYFAVQITGYCGGWSFWFTERHHHAARQIITAVIFCFCFKHNAFTSLPPFFHFRLQLSGQISAKYLCTKLIAIEPSPTADATRFIAPARTSPAAKMPVQLVSNKYGSRSSFHIFLKAS